MDDAMKHNARVQIEVEFEIVDPTALRTHTVTEDSDGELTVWNQTDEEAALRVLTDLAVKAWTSRAGAVGLGHGFGLQTRVLPYDEH
ncbi:hypothetical protein [Brevibacterium renqingii]|uniref:hypothetical protein n=1 Tax=Brevibacterium renqingii TaxID=2776916 RepID=UPI001ADEDA2F|nr:hypothetical protein [Brevibacterium renqingii]